MKPLRLSQTDVIEPEVMHDVYYITLPNDRLSSGDVFVRMQKV